jgi:hypothetical protein
VGVQLAQVAVASLGPVLLFRLTLSLTGARLPAIIGALLLCVHPMLVRHASSATDSALTSVLVLAFAAASVNLSNHAAALKSGLWLGLAVLSRTTLMPLTFIVAVVQMLRGKVVEGAIVVVVAAGVLTPWMVRNYRVNGSWLPTRSGINLYIGNSPYTAALFPEHDLDLLEAPAYELALRARPDIAPGDPDYVVKIDAYLTRISVDRMLQSPLRTAKQKIENVAYFMSPYLIPHHVAAAQTRLHFESPATVSVENFVVRPWFQIVIYFVFTAFVMVAALIGVYLRRHAIGAEAMLWAVAVTVVCVHAVYFPASRYRAPMSFVFLHYAGIALAAAMSWRPWQPRTAGAR